MSLDEIIFIDRNQSYGAYDLRRSYPDHIKRSLLGLLFFITIAGAGQKILSLRHPSKAETMDGIVCHLSPDIPIPMIEKPIIKPPKLGQATAATMALATLAPARDNTTEKDTTQTLDPNLDISDHTQKGTPGETLGRENGTALSSDKVETPKEPETVNWATEMPQYRGGETALTDFVRNHLEYPRYEAEIGIQGRVAVGFIIDENGKVTNIRIIKGISKGIDNEAMRVVKLLHDFKPGSQNGRKVRVSYVLPLSFALAHE